MSSEPCNDDKIPNKSLDDSHKQKYEGWKAYAYYGLKYPTIFAINALIIVFMIQYYIEESPPTCI